MKAAYTLAFVGLAVLSVRGQAAVYEQCGGKGYTGSTECASGSVCSYQNPWYSQCLPTSGASSNNSECHPHSATHSAGTHTHRPTSKPSTTPVSSNPSTHPTSANPTTTPAASSTPPVSSNPATTPSTGGATPTASAGKVKFAGVNIAGFDFGTGTDGSSSASGAVPPLTEYNGPDGAGQMNHFVKDDKYNLFRLPVSWQYLTNDAPTGTLDETNFEKYDALVQACLKTGAYCIIDIHNYARYNGQIIGQGGPSNDVFASLWHSIASNYVHESKVMFGIMNEPHDVDVLLWADTVQAAVTAIRKTGATMHTILLPGTDYASAETFVSSGSAAALSAVTNPDGSKKNLIFDVHRYLDSDHSGTSDTCVTNNIDASWKPLAAWLRSNGRQALNTETGGGNTESCETYLLQQIQYQAENSDVIPGWASWAAGSFSTSYVLSETPTNNGGTWTDQALVAKVLAPSVNGLLA